MLRFVDISYCFSLKRFARASNGRFGPIIGFLSHQTRNVFFVLIISDSGWWPGILHPDWSLLWLWLPAHDHQLRQVAVAQIRVRRDDRVQVSLRDSCQVHVYNYLCKTGLDLVNSKFCWSLSLFLLLTAASERCTSTSSIPWKSFPSSLNVNLKSVVLWIL